MSKSERAAPDYALEHFDEVNYPRPEATEFEKLADKAMSRRGFLGASLAFGASAFVMGAGALRPAEAAGRLAFEPVAANALDQITLPKGYAYDILASWGDPLWSRGPAFDEATRGTAASQELSFGDNTDGMAVFDLGDRTVIAINNEYCNIDIINIFIG